MTDKTKTIELQVLEAELEWSTANRSDTRFDDGFIAGIRQAIRLVETAQKELADFDRKGTE